MAVTVRIPTALRSQAGGITEVSVEADTVAQALRGLQEAIPGLTPLLRDESGELRPRVSIFVNDEHVRYRQGLDTPLRAGDWVYVMPVITGG
jgi:molybdopterin synthase sulfur carrier subunit